jgi:hypothetical protein
VTKRANGEGTIYQRKDGRWETAVYVLMPDGTRRRQRVYGRRREDVARKLADLIARSNAGIPTEANDWTLERFLTHWLEHVVAPARKPKTYQCYEVVVRIHLIPARRARCYAAGSRMTTLIASAGSGTA